MACLSSLIAFGFGWVRLWRSFLIVVMNSCFCGAVCGRGSATGVNMISVEGLAMSHLRRSQLLTCSVAFLEFD